MTDTLQRLHSQGIDHYRGGRYAEAASCFEEACVAARAADDRRCVAEALNDLGVARRELGEWDAALAALTEARSLFVALGDRKGEAQSIGNLASVYEGRGDHAAAAEAYRTAAALFEELGESDLAMYSWQALSRMHLNQKHWLPAIAAYEEGIEAMPDGSLKKGLLRRLVRLPGQWLFGSRD